MAQIIKNRRGSIGNVKDVTTQNAEVLVASGSIGDLSGPFILYGSPSPSDSGLTGVYKPASKIYQGANVPTISVGTYGNVLDGTPFYSSASKALYILNAAGNTLMDLAGNLSGSVFPYIIASGSFSGSFQGNGSGLTNISASSVVGLNLNQIDLGTVSASVYTGSTSFQVVSSSNNLLTLENNGNFFVNNSINIDNELFKWNVSLGQDALTNLTSGGENIGIGYTSLLLTSTGYSNIGIGVSALRLNSVGESNIAIGTNASDKNISGSNNIAIGVASNQNAGSNQNNNTFVGYQSGYNNAGDYNTFLGSQAGEGNLSGSYNTILGRGSLPLANQSNSLALFDGNYNLKLYSPSTHNIILGGTTDNLVNKLQVSGSVIATSFTGSLFGTASYTPNLQEVTNQGTSTTNALTMSGAFINGNTIISGDLDVNGTITYISSSTLIIGDNIIEINANKAAGNSGMIVYDTTSPFTASLLWDVTTDRWIAGPYGSESTIILASDTSSMSVNFARTASYSTTLGASLTSSAPDQVRLLASNGSTLSTITINNVASASYALTASYVNPLNQNLLVNGYVSGSTGFYDGTGAGVIQFAYLNASKQLAYLTPSTAGDLIQWNGTAMTASNVIDGGTF